MGGFGVEDFWGSVVFVLLAGFKVCSELGFEPFAFGFTVEALLRRSMPLKPETIPSPTLSPVPPTLSFRTAPA